MHSKGKVSMYKPGTRPTEDGKISVVQVEKDAKDKSADDEDEFLQTKSKSK